MSACIVEPAGAATIAACAVLFVTILVLVWNEIQPPGGGE